MSRDVNKPAPPGATKPPDRGDQGVGLLVKAFQVLDLFTDAHGPWTQAELARETGLNRSTLSRLIRFLAARGFLAESRGAYTLGFAAIEIGQRAQLQFDLVSLFGDMLEALAQSSYETAILNGYDAAGGRAVCLSQIPSRQGGLQVYESVGTGSPLHSGASAKAILAFLPERKREAVLSGDLAHVNPVRTQTAAELRADLAAIRARGYAISREETYPGTVGVSVPILTPSGHAIGSLAIAAPLQRVTPEALDSFASRLLEIGAAANGRLSAREGARP